MPRPYTTALTHFLTEDPEISQQAVCPFKVYDSVMIKKLLVTNSPDNQKHKSVLRNNDLPHLYVYYETGKNIDKVDVKFTVKDETAGKTLYTTTLERPGKVKDKTQRAGIRLDKDVAIVPMGHTASFQAEVIPPDGKIKSQTVKFSVQPYEITLLVPNRLKSNQPGKFKLTLPKEFNAPYAIDLDTSSGLILHHNPGALTGTVTGIAEDSYKQAQIYAKVTDSRGRIGKASGSVTILPITKPKLETAYKPTHKPKPKSTTSELEWKEKYGGFDNYLREKYQVKKGTNICHGKYYFYYENGQPWHECDYVNNEKHGIEKCYRTDGTVYEITHYANGKEHGEKRIYRKGRLSIIERWKNGKMVERRPAGVKDRKY